MTFIDILLGILAMNLFMVLQFIAYTWIKSKLHRVTFKQAVMIEIDIFEEQIETVCKGR